MLSPGRYQFHGKYKGDLVSERPLEWRVVCATKEQNIIGRGLIMRGGNSRELKDLDFPITVPANKLPGAVRETRVRREIGVGEIHLGIDLV